MRTPSGFGGKFVAALLVASSVVRGALAQAPEGPSPSAPAPKGPSPSAPAPEEPSPSAPAPADVPAALAPPPPATGPRPLAESLEGDAKREYELGRLLYDNGDYAGALVRFESARKASADARLLWNVAVCQKALHHYAKAIAAMRSYLASSSPLISPTTAASARNFMTAAEPLTARLEVSSNADGALVYADGESLGRAPLGPEARLDWGSHQIMVKKQDYLDYEQTVAVTCSADVRVAAVLRPIVHQGRIIVRAGSGDLISLDGVTRAWGTWEGVLTSGGHLLRVSAAGFRAHEQQIIVADAQTRGFDITLQRGPRSSLPTWVWLVAGTVLATGAATAGYFIFRPPASAKPTEGSIATVRFDLR